MSGPSSWRLVLRTADRLAEDEPLTVPALRVRSFSSRWRGMQLVVETLIQSLPSVGHVLMFGGFLFGIFAILGVQLFAGRMSGCNQVRHVRVGGWARAATDERRGRHAWPSPLCAAWPQAVLEDGQPVEWKDQCGPGVFNCTAADSGCVVGEETERSWSRPFLNYDNVGNALLTLFVVRLGAACSRVYVGRRARCVGGAAITHARARCAARRCPRWTASCK